MREYIKSYLRLLFLPDSVLSEAGYAVVQESCGTAEGGHALFRIGVSNHCASRRTFRIRWYSDSSSRNCEDSVLHLPGYLPRDPGDGHRTQGDIDLSVRSAEV
jgi:hypothetical protein